jgi:hypothetical protein
MPSPATINLLQVAMDTLNLARLQLDNLQKALLAPDAPQAPASPDNTLLVPGGTPGMPTFITDVAGNTWTLQPNGASSTPTLFMNAYPDPFTGPASLALFLNSKLYFQRLTGQWYEWATNHWLPSTNPQVPASPEWGPPAKRSIDALDFNWLPSGDCDLDLLTDLFTDSSPRASTFLPSPIPIVTRPRGILSTTLLYQRSDNVFRLPIFNSTTPVTFQFPGLRPSFIRLWDGIRPGPTARNIQRAAERVATGTDTIAVPMKRGAFFIIELSLG